MMEQWQHISGTTQEITLQHVLRNQGAARNNLPWCTTSKLVNIRQALLTNAARIRIDIRTRSGRA